MHGQFYATRKQEKTQKKKNELFLRNISKRSKDLESNCFKILKKKAKS